MATVSLVLGEYCFHISWEDSNNETAVKAVVLRFFPAGWLVSLHISESQTCACRDSRGPFSWLAWECLKIPEEELEVDARGEGRFGHFCDTNDWKARLKCILCHSARPFAIVTLQLLPLLLSPRNNSVLNWMSRLQVHSFLNESCIMVTLVPS